MPKTLAELRVIVQGDLTDATNVHWTNAEIDRSIRRSIYRYSEIRPLQQITTMVAADSREYSVAALPGLMEIERVWWPYTVGTPEYPPKWVRFELWADKKTIFLFTDERPSVGSGDLRIFYTSIQTISGLDGALVGTYPNEDEEIIITGATGYAAVQRARYVADTVNPSAMTPELWVKWGNARLFEFECGLKNVAARIARHGDARVVVDWEDLDTFLERGTDPV